MPALILCYHSNNVEGNDYHNNDHVALASDLATLSELNIGLASAIDIARAVRGELPWDRVDGRVAITFDDGSHFDWFDMPHPTWGKQPGFASILRTAQVQVSAASFVIVSPAARRVLDQRVLVGRNWWTDTWWPEAAQSGLMTMENHSWDHVHESLDEVAQQDNLKGDFRQVQVPVDCQAQITRASDYLQQVCGTRPRLFAYPYGQWHPRLARQWLPENEPDHHLVGAVTTEPRSVGRNTGPWLLPRLVCGADWTSPDEFKKILTDL